MDPRLRTACQTWDCQDPVPLHGGEGERQYWRVRHPQLGSALIALYPHLPPGAEEDAFYEYRALQAYLDPVLRVATTLRVDDGLRAMLVEDLGGTTLEARLSARPEEEPAWAEAVGELLASWLGLLTEGAPARAFFMLRRHDQARLGQAWEGCRSAFFAAFLEKEPPRWLDRMMEEVRTALDARTCALTHGDFTVANLMVRGDRLVTLDFQDAGKGVASHDLASVLFDPHWEWTEEARSVLVARVGAELGWSERLLWEELNLAGLQRAFAQLGISARALLEHRRPRAAAAIPRLLRHLHAHFLRIRHGEGVLAAEHWQRLAERRLLKP